jgi:hypothetical protein
MSSSTHGERPPNRLARETSPYLLQHASNPVDWWPWGREALAEARRLNKPILLSVGYAACHWCHVMAHESFEDEATARVMNELFINIKVDREERPDIDLIYMNALHLLGEQGGWPLTMFLGPTGEPFWGGTYFPKESRFGRPAFTDVLREIARTYREHPDKIAHNCGAILQHLDQRRAREEGAPIGYRDLDEEARKILGAIDPAHGGLRVAPKFPQCTMLEFLWRAGARGCGAQFFDAVSLTLTRMSQGGIYDHLGGGYARYSVDEKWLVPHFEKMLYDNAQILDLLALEHARLPDPLFASRAEETVSWLAREMTTVEGGFASSLDADSEGEEGRFYVWSLDEIERVLGADDAALFASLYDVTAHGNFEGHNILNRLTGREPTAEETPRLADLRARLAEARNTRVRPGLDDKVLADWNGLMIAALARASVAFGRPAWRAHAERAFAFVERAMTRGDRLGHSWREGRLQFPGLASDYAAMIRAALALYEITSSRDYLDAATRWQQSLDRHHHDQADGGYFLTADDADALILRPRATHDDAIPNHHGLIAENLLRLAVLGGDDVRRDAADRLLEATLPHAAKEAFGHLSLLNALDAREAMNEVVIVGNGAAAEALFKAALKLPFATREVVRIRNTDALPARHPAHAAPAAPQGAAALVCRNQVCSLPVTDPDDLRRRVLLA